MSELRTNEKQRDAGPELLRIAAMVMIIFYNVAIHSELPLRVSPLNGTILSLLTSGGMIGVSFFILITGYYSVNVKSSVKKAARLILLTVLYSVVMYLVSCAVGANQLRLKYFFLSTVPFLSDKGYWFITTYLLLYALIPLLNGGLGRLKQGQHLFLIGLFFFVWSLLPNTYGAFFRDQGYGYSNLGWFVLLYMTGAYLSMYPPKLFARRGLSLCLLLGAVALRVAGRVLETASFSLPGRWDTLYRAILDCVADSSIYSPFVFLIAVLAFIVFRPLRIKGNRFLFALSASTFGVYLIHDNAWTREYLWNKLLRVSEFAQSRFFALEMIGIMLAVFAVCAAIEIARKKLLEEPLFRSRPYRRFEEGCGRLLEDIGRRFALTDRKEG